MMRPTFGLVDVMVLLFKLHVVYRRSVVKWLR